MEQVYIKDNEGNKVLPITSDKAVRDENGNPLGSRLSEIKYALDARYTKQETYSKNQLNNLITTPNQKYVTVTATDQTTAVTDVLPATGAADTTYRVGNWDGTQHNDSVFSEYAWNGSAYIKLSTKSQIGEVYDISANHADTEYADLAAALGTNGANVPPDVRKGGMSVKFVQTSDHKYVQYRYMETDATNAATFTNIANWQGVDDTPTPGSNNLVKSGGVAVMLDKVSEIDKEYGQDESDEVIITDNNDNIVFEANKDFVDAKNLKRNGQDVLTQHQDISGKADKTYVDEKLAYKQDKIDGLTSETIVETVESIEFLSDDLSDTYTKIDRNGVHAKSINLFSESPSEDKDISSDYSLDFEDEVVFTDEDDVPSVAINKHGIKVRSLMDINGSQIPLGSAYISPNGNDANTGTDPTHPMKTINGALAKGFNSIILLEGVYKQTIDTTQINSHKIEIKGASGKKVVLKKADSLISDSGEEVLVNGYTKVYKLENVADINYGSATNRAEWLFFDDKADETTPISSYTAHPLESGKFYRCDCTKSIKTTASTLVDALTEIEALGENIYKWFYDSENHILYFNRPDSTSVYALYKSTGNYFTTNENQSLILSNIEFRYGVVNLYRLNTVKVYNCCAQCVYGPGAFGYDYSLSVEFIKCEAALCFSGTNGDGFNAHANDSSGDYRTKRNQCMQIECWSHDNNDDGYSDHEYGETTIIGGLYEYNKKGGVVPSFGSHCTCYNTYSRHNYSGFSYVGVANDRGNNGQLACYNCISEKNDGGGTKVGYYVTNGNRVQLFNCLAINEVTGFKCVSGCYMDLYDCKTLACTTQKVAEGTLNVYNSIIVS